MVQFKINAEMQKQIKNEIRGYMVAQGHTFESLSKLISEKYKKNATAQNISNKLQRGSIKYAEVIEIAEALGYKIKWEIG
jgi:hypothetical protein